jgi:hypothetical protein
MRVLLVVLVAAACGKSSEPSGAGSAAPATPRDAVVAAWKADKLAPQLAAAQVSVGKDCQAGAVEQLDVLVCNFATPAEAKAAEAAGNAWVGAATGASQAHGAALIVIADRKKADPNGRTINRLMKLAPGEPVR